MAVDLSDGMREALLSALLEQSQARVEQLDADGHLLHVSSMGSAAAPTAADALGGQLWTERWPETAYPMAEDALRAAREGSTARFKAARLDVAGQPHWWEVMVKPIETGGLPDILSSRGIYPPR